MNVKNIMMLLLLALLSCDSVFTAPDEIYLFRHSEKSSGENPSLTEQGEKRAQSLISLLEKYNKVQLFSSNYKRTLQTIAPLEKYFKTKTEVYNASDLIALQNTLLDLDGVVIVIGHSNTTPKLAELLSGDNVEPMHETDFTRYFLLNKNNETHKYDVSDLTMNF